MPETEDKVPVGSRWKATQGNAVFCTVCSVIVVTGQARRGENRVYHYEPGGDHLKATHSPPADGRPIESFLKCCVRIDLPAPISEKQPTAEETEIEAIKIQLRRPTPLQSRAQVTYLKPK